MKVLHKTLFLIIILFAIRIFASPQIPDYIIYKGDTIPTYNLILEQLLHLQNKSLSILLLIPKS